MKINTIAFLVFILAFTTTNLGAQQKDYLQWGDIPEADLKMTSYKYDSTAPAVILGDIGKSDVYLNNSTGYEHSLFHHRRIKILSEEGFGYADISIPYYHVDGTDWISNLKAQIISPSGEVIKLGKKEMFKKKINDSFSEYTFTFPNVEVGSVIEYSYRKMSKSLIVLDSWYFHNSIPTRWSELKVSLSDEFGYVTLFEGAEYMTVTEVEKGATTYAQEETKLRVESGHYLMQNAPAIKEEEYMTCVDDYRARIRFQLQEFQSPNGIVERFMSTWPNLAKEILEWQDFGEQFLKKRYVKAATEVLDKEVLAMNSDQEKVAFLYKYIATNFDWNKKYRISVDDNIGTVFKKKQGSSAELNLLLLALLKHYELDAEPILVSTRSNGRMVQLYPIIEQFNHVLVVVVADGKVQLLDASDPLRPAGLPKVEALNSYGWVVHKENPQWIAIQAPLGVDSYQIKVDLKDNGDIAGQMRISFNNYTAVTMRNILQTKDPVEYWTEALTEKMDNILIDSVAIENHEDLTQRYVNKIYYTIKGEGELDDIVYLSPIPYLYFADNPFDLEKRLYPVDFPFPFKEKTTVFMTIPEGYEVDELPENKRVSLPESSTYYNFIIEQKGSNIILRSDLQIDQLKVLPDHYGTLKEMFDTNIEKSEELIVLKKRT